ncbi:MAG: O-antigen ligase family protein [Propionicimonas sp.]
MTAAPSPVGAPSGGAGAIPGIDAGKARTSLGSKLFSFLAAIVGAVSAMLSGFAWAGGDKTRIVLPLVALATILFGVLALTRFAAFVYLVIGMRATIDLFKLSGPSAGNTVTNSAASRALDPSSILGVLFLLAAAAWLISRYYDQGHLRGSRLRLMLVLFWVAGIVSVMGSSIPLVSTMETLRIGTVVMMFVVLEQIIVDRRTMKRVLVAAYASMLFPLLYTFYGFATGNPSAEVKGGFTRITGPFSQSTTYGRYLAFMIIFGVAVFPYLKGRLKVAMGLILAISSVFLLLTLTRGALAGAIAGLVVVMIVQRSRTMVVGFALATVLALTLAPGLWSRISEVSTTQDVGGAPTGNTLEWRLEYWTQVLPLANANPVTGIGLNVTQYKTGAAKQPHNDFIRAYVETGLFGLITFVGALWALVRMGRQAVRRAAPDSLDRGVAVGYLGAVVAYVLQSAGANVMSNVVCLMYLIAFAGAASFIARQPERLPPPTTQSHLKTSPVNEQH